MPIRIDTGSLKAASQHPRRKTTLGEPDPKKPLTARSFADLAKEVWLNDTLNRQFYGDWVPRSAEDLAWEDAVRWIERKYAPPEPEPAITFEWRWPTKNYSRYHEPDECDW